MRRTSSEVEQRSRTTWQQVLRVCLASASALALTTCTTVPTDPIPAPPPPPSASRQAPAATITAPADGSAFQQGQPITFTGLGTDSEDGGLTGGSLVWTSSRDGRFGTGGSVITSALSLGSHDITLTATDSDGADGSASVSIIVAAPANQAPSAAIAAPADGSSFQQGQTITFNGSGADPEDGTLTGSSLVWSSSRDGQLGTGTSVGTSGLSPGSHVITLRVTDSQGASGTATVSITVVLPGNQAPTATITAPADGSGFQQGQAITFTGTGSDPEDGSLTGASLVWMSSLDGQLGTDVSVTTSGLSVGSHDITLTATDQQSATGTATIAITVTSGPPPSLTCGGLVSGSTSVPGDVDVYTFNGTSGALVNLAISVTSGFGGGARALVTVFTPSSSVVTSLTSRGQSAFALRESGTYQVRVSAQNGTSTGDYDLSLACLLPPGSDAVAMSPGDLVAGATTAGADVDVFTFSGSAGEFVNFAISVTSGYGGGARAFVTVFSPSHAVVTSFASRGQHAFALPESGTYAVRVNSQNFIATGSYDVSLEGLAPASPSAVSLDLGDLVAGATNAGADADVFTFSGSAGDLVNLAISVTSGYAGGARAFVTVFSPSHTVVTSFASRGQQAFALPESGTYAVRVNSQNFIATGGYDLSLEGLDPASPSAIALSPGNSVSASTSVGGDVDVYTVAGSSGENVTVSIAVTGGYGGGARALVTIFQPAGTVLTSFVSSGAQSVTLPESGTYAIRVNSQNFIATGTYNILLTKP